MENTQNQGYNPTPLESSNKPLTGQAPPTNPISAIKTTKKEELSGGPPMREASEGHGELFFDRLLKLSFVLSVFLLPIFYILSSDITGLSKSLLLSVLSLIALLAWVGKIISQGSIQWRKTWLVWPALAVGLVVLLSNFFSPSFWVSFLGDAGRSTFSTVSVLSYIILFFAALANLTRKDTFWLVLTLVASSALAAILSLLQFLGVFILPGSFTSNTLFNPVGSVFSLALFLAFTTPIILELFERSKKMLNKVVFAIIGLLQLFLILVIDFRTVWLVLAISFLFYLALVIFKQGFLTNQWTSQKRIVIPLVIFIISILFWLLPNLPLPTITNIPSEVSPSYGASLGVLGGSWSENPILGEGPEMFAVSYAAHKSPALNQTNFWGVNFNGANAEVITWFSNYGILGALAWLTFVIGFLLIAVKGLKSKEESALQIGILSSWLFILASKFFYQTPLPLELFFWLLPIFFLIRLGGTSFSLKKYDFKAGSVLTLAAFVTSVVLLVVSIGSLFLSVQRWFGEQSYAKIFTNDGTAETRDGLISSITSAINLNSKEARYYRSLSQVLLAKVNDITVAINARPAGEQQATEEEATLIQSITVDTLNALGEAQRLDPKNIGLLVDAAESYKLMNAYVGGANDQAITVYEAAVELEPINPFLKTQLAQLYLVQDNFFVDRQVKSSEGITKAEELLAEAIELNPNYSNAHYFNGFVLDRKGDRDAALLEFQGVLSLNPNDQGVQIIVRNLQQGLTALGPPPPAQPVAPPVLPDDAQGVPQ